MRAPTLIFIRWREGKPTGLKGLKLLVFHSLTVDRWLIQRIGLQDIIKATKNTEILQNLKRTKFGVLLWNSY